MKTNQPGDDRVMISPDNLIKDMRMFECMVQFVRSISAALPTGILFLVGILWA